MQYPTSPIVESLANGGSALVSQLFIFDRLGPSERTAYVATIRRDIHHIIEGAKQMDAVLDRYIMSDPELINQLGIRYYSTGQAFLAATLPGLDQPELFLVPPEAPRCGNASQSLFARPPGFGAPSITSEADHDNDEVRRNIEQWAENVDNTTHWGFSSEYQSNPYPRGESVVDYDAAPSLSDGSSSDTVEFKMDTSESSVNPMGDFLDVPETVPLVDYASDFEDDDVVMSDLPQLSYTNDLESAHRVDLGCA